MYRRLDILIFKAKAVLCACALFIAPIVLTGCGTGAFAPGATRSAPVEGDGALAQKLSGTPFAGGRQIDVDSVAQSFRITDSAGAVLISGDYANDVAGRAYVASLALRDNNRVTTIAFNSNREITDVTTSTGAWRKPVSISAPTAPTAPTAPGARATGEVDQYVAANADLMDQARQADAQSLGDLAASVTQSDVKTGDQAFAPLLWALAGATIWPLGVAGTFLWVFELVVLLQIIF